MLTCFRDLPESCFLSGGESPDGTKFYDFSKSAEVFFYLRIVAGE